MPGHSDQHARELQATAILKSLRQDSGGRLNIFLGSAPGVGKTYAMLNTAKERQLLGERVLVGLVETHGRHATERLLEGLDILPLRQIQYLNQTLSEFDLDAALERKPQLILVDELAHTNIPGSRHKRRYQDIAELLEAGIDVYTTLNIQHLASLNDLVLQITGVRVQETVPDHVVDHAHEIVFIDLPTETLIERLQQGKVYLPEYASAALNGFFSPSHLTALRELAMREVMKRVDVRLQNQLNAQAKGLEYVIQNKLLVLISINSTHEYLIRSGRQIADRRKIPWQVIWVDTGHVPTPEKTRSLQMAFSLANELGAKTEVLRGSSTYQAIIPYITEHRINTVLVGAGTRRGFPVWRKQLYQQLIESGLPLEVSVIRSTQSAPSSTTNMTPSPAPSKSILSDRRGYGFSLLVVSAATIVALMLEPWIHNTNLVLIYVLGVIATGLRYGSRPAMAASTLSFLSFNFFLTEPRHTLLVTHRNELETLIFLFLIAIICGPVASRIRRQFLLLEEGNRYSEALRNLGQALSIAEDGEALWRATATHLSTTLHQECCIAVRDENGRYTTFPSSSSALSPVDNAALEWTHKHRAASGRLTDTLNASSWTVFPITKDTHCIACALVRIGSNQFHFAAYDKALIEVMLQQAADTWRRIQLVGAVESARVKTEVEQLRSALLSSVSHDLKSPLAAMMGAAESLRLLDQQLEPQDRLELIDTILQESRRLDCYIQNLLDMTRLGYGTLKIERDWVSVADIVGSALARLKRYFPSIKTEVQFQQLTPVLYVHAALIEQALLNILENAARFTPDNEKIQIVIATQDQQCIITIEDKGPGIAESQREKIFDLFYAIEDGDSKQNHTGMGLAICRGMIGAHGGSVRALAGTDHKGTRIVVKLPLDYPATNNDH